MKHIITVFLLVFLSSVYAEDSIVSSVKDSQLNFILNNISIVLEKNNPDIFPAILRLVELPDQTDDCSWVAKDIPIASMEHHCPLRKLYLTLSNWDMAPDNHSYLIGIGNDWKVTDLVINQRKSQSDWSAILKLEVVMLLHGKEVTKVLNVSIGNKYDVYTVRLIER